MCVYMRICIWHYMHVQYIRAMYNEHKLVAGASKSFTAWNAGHKIETTPEREWGFVVGTHGLDRSTWTFDVAGAQPVVEEGMLVDGRNAKELAALLQSPQVKRAGVSAAEVVALRLYTGNPSSRPCVASLVYMIAQVGR